MVKRLWQVHMLQGRLFFNKLWDTCPEKLFESVKRRGNFSSAKVLNPPSPPPLPSKNESSLVVAPPYHRDDKTISQDKPYWSSQGAMYGCIQWKINYCTKSIRLLMLLAGRGWVFSVCTWCGVRGGRVERWACWNWQPAVCYLTVTTRHLTLYTDTHTNTDNTAIQTSRLLTGHPKMSNFHEHTNGTLFQTPSLPSQSVEII